MGRDLHVIVWFECMFFRCGDDHVCFFNVEMTMYVFTGDCDDHRGEKGLKGDEVMQCSCQSCVCVKSLDLFI